MYYLRSRGKIKLDIPAIIRLEISKIFDCFVQKILLATINLVTTGGTVGMVKQLGR